MTLDPGRLGPPLTASGAALWFGRNFLEALIWASAGALVLMLLLAIGSFPQVAGWTLLCGLVLACVAWATFGFWRAASPPRPSVLQFDVFRIITIKVIFAGTRRDPHRDRP